MIAPIQNIHVPAIASGQYVHMNVSSRPRWPADTAPVGTYAQPIW
jgi:hypothetical protein